MTSHQEDHFKKSMEALEDLYCLTPKENRSLLNQLYFHLTNLKSTAEEEDPRHDDFSFVKKTLKDQVEDTIVKFVRKNALGVAKRKWNKVEHKSIENWNKCIELIPYSFYILKFFEAKRNVNYEIGINFFKLSFEIDDLVDLKSIRSKAYAFTKSMLAKEVLLTYSIEEAKNKSYRLSLVFDYSYVEEYSYLVEVGEGLKDSLLFPNCFNSYKISKELFDSLDKHLVLTIQNDFNLKYEFSDPVSKNQLDLDCEIIHFSFLFRPISIIIPREGKVVFSPGASSFGVTGSMSGRKEQEVQDDISSKIHTFDFFSIFAK